MHELEKGRTENQDPIWDESDRPVKRRIEREEQKGKNRNPKPMQPKKTKKEKKRKKRTKKKKDEKKKEKKGKKNPRTEYKVNCQAQFTIRRRTFQRASPSLGLSP